MLFTKRKRDNPADTDWQLYEKGRDYNYSLGLYEKVSTNERCYRGDQWEGINTNGLPSPVFNVFKRFIDYYIPNILSVSASLRYSFDSTESDQPLEALTELCSSVADHHWEQNKISSMLADALRDAALSGDAVAYTYWDSRKETGQAYKGDFCTVLVDNTNVFFGNPNVHDVQAQPYILISGRELTEDVRLFAKSNGVDERLIDRIMPDCEVDTQSGERAAIELEGTKCITLLKLWRGENGNIYCRKSVKDVMLTGDIDLGIKLYPVCCFNWTKVKNCWHGEPAATGLIDNQIFINKGYAMVMKHMMDTAFSKVVYDSTIIDEWSNRVGEAIAVNGSVDNVAKVITGGTMQAGMLEVLNNAIAHTKEFLGATDTALGNVDPKNTSAIIAVQQASAMPLQNIRRQLHQFIEDMGLIWLEFMLYYYDEFRKVPFKTDGGMKWVEFTQKNRVQNLIRSCKVDVGASTQWSEIWALNTLDNLLTMGKITTKQYLERLPDGIIPKKQALIEQITMNNKQLW